ncbi:hypothetical protein AB0N81_32490 [Streptomyces sp. NPDC093510]|uniref:hypothetical protein n=1 Tax=Streptomyces sp. NPDC093510 TaxID=3155199 RepID=UPI003426C789
MATPVPGYATLCLALGSPDSRVITCDISDQGAAMAEQAWKDAGASSRQSLGRRDRASGRP